jgi:hypothetical protein
MIQKLPILGFLICFSILSTKVALSLETVTLLDRGEPYPSMVAASGVFWIGQSRKQFNADYHLEVYSIEGKLIDRIQLTHSLSSIKTAPNGTVVVTGINPVTHLTEYTFAKLKNKKIQFKTTEISVDGFINFWIGNLGNSHYFADMGGNPNDTNQNFELPAQTLFYSTGSSPRYLSARVRMPIAGTVLNNKLIMVSREGFKSDAGSLVEVDPVSSSARVLSTTKNAHYNGLEIIPSTQEIMTSALALNKLLVFDSTSGTLKRELSTSGYTRSFAITGHCAIAGNDETHNIEVFDLNSKEDTALFSEPVNMPLEEFSGIKQIAVDEATGTVFARSTIACNPLIEACDKDDNRVVTFGPSVAQKIQGLCK